MAVERTGANIAAVGNTRLVWEWTAQARGGQQTDLRDALVIASACIPDWFDIALETTGLIAVTVDAYIAVKALAASLMSIFARSSINGRTSNRHVAIDSIHRCAHRTYDL